MRDAVTPSSHDACDIDLLIALQLGSIQRQEARPVWTSADSGWQQWETHWMLVAGTFWNQLVHTFQTMLHAAWTSSWVSTA